MRAALDRWFPERQFYYRSQGVVRFITLGKKSQIAACGGLALVLGWLTFTSVQVVLRNEIIASKNDRIREVTAAFDALARRSAETEKRFLTITGEVEARHRQLVALVDYRSRLELDIQELHGALARTAGERDQARADVDGLRRRINAVEQELAAATVNANGLARTLDVTQRNGQALALAREAVVDENRALTGHIAELTAALRGAVAARGTELERTIADLNARNATTTKRTTELLRDLGRAEDQATRVATERDEALRSRDFMAHLVDELQYRLTGLKELQFDLVERLRVRADDNVAMAETRIKQTGLNIDQLLTNAPNGDGMGAAMGGPYAPSPTPAARTTPRTHSSRR